MYKGAHIKVYRGGYWHHGIYLGNDEVVHFSGEPKRKRRAKIEKTSLRQFVDGGGEAEVVGGYQALKNPDEIVATALSLVGSGGYELFSNNCEHFAYYCRTGVKYSILNDDYSDQVKDAIEDITSTEVPFVEDSSVVGLIAGATVGIAKVATRTVGEKIVYAVAGREGRKAAEYVHNTFASFRQLKRLRRR